MKHEWWKRAQNCIAQGALTNSKHPESLVYGLYPTHVKSGHGCYLYDSGDRRYIDFICGLGANFFGYGAEPINKVVLAAIYGGVSHSLPTVHEVECAEALKTVFPFVDAFKFVKTGSEACSASVKIARQYTGRSKVLSEGYHGHADIFVSLSDPAGGVTDKHDIVKLIDLEQIDRETACVIVEPVMTVYDTARIEWLKSLRAKCTEMGAVLIFDEIITGFRYEKFGVSNRYNIIPDLICIGKAMANGFPLAAVGGKYALMNDDQYFVSSTYAGDVISLIACKEVVRLLHTSHHYDINHLHKTAMEFQTSLNEMLPEGMYIEGYGTRGAFKGDEETIALFMQGMGKADILFCKSLFFNFPLIAQVENVLNAAQGVCDKISRGQVKLEYPMPKSPFAEKVRNDRHKLS